MKNKLKITVLSMFLTLVGILFSCQDETLSEAEQSLSELKSGSTKSDILLEMGYDIETTCDYKFDEKSCSKLDMAYLNPKKEKERIFMRYYCDGSMDMIVEKLDVKDNIKVQHKVQKSDIPEITKTVVSNGEMSVYQKDGKLIETIKYPQENNTDLVDNLKAMIAENSEKEIENFVCSMQGGVFANNINTLVEESKTNSNMKVEEFGETYVTLRMKMSEIDQRSTEDMVLLIDRSRNRLAGSRIYNEKGELEECTYFGYNSGKRKYLSAIKSESYSKLPSGKNYVEVSNSYIDNFDYELYY